MGANSGFDEVQRADRRSLIQDMIGDGYHFVESVRNSNRTFKRHKALAIAQIKRIAGPDNPMKQQQLAAALVEHYKGGGGDNCEVATEEYIAHAAVIGGLVETLKMLKGRNAGRYTREDRISHEVLIAGALSKAKGSVLHAVTRLLEIRPQTAKKVMARMETEASKFCVCVCCV